MKKFAEKYWSDLHSLMDRIEVTGQKKKTINYFSAIEKAGVLLRNQTRTRRKIMFIGNGASAAISSHMSTDFWKNGKMRAMAFNDGSLLTCLGNDCGYASVFEKSVEMFADKGDVLIAISSSGQSENIVRGARAAKAKACKVITLSGFASNNPLSKLGDFNFYVPNPSYGLVEIVHQAICHCLLDAILHKAK